MNAKLVTLFIALAFGASAHAAKGHNHGVGELDVGIDNGQITIELELPLDSVVGFEHAPKTDKEKAAITEAEHVLKDAPSLFLTTPEAGCTPESITVTMPYTNGPKPHAEEHADIDALYVFRCTTPAALKSVETTLFKHFTRLYRLEARRAGPAGQGATRLSARQPKLSW